MVVGVVTDLYAIERVLTAQNVTKRNSLSADAQKRQPQISQVRFAHSQTRVESRYVRIRKDGGTLITFPRGSFNSQAILYGIVYGCPVRNDFHINRTAPAQTFIAFSKVISLVGSGCVQGLQGRG